MNIDNSASKPSSYYYIGDDRKILKSAAKKITQVVKNNEPKNEISKKDMIKQVKGALSRLGIEVPVNTQNNKKIDIWS